MKKMSGFFLLLSLGMITTFFGCADLKTIDFSGEIQLTPQATSEREGMIPLCDDHFSTRWRLDRDLFFRPSALGDYLDALIFERAYSSRDGIMVGKEVAVCGSPLMVTTTVNRNGKIYLEAEDKAKGFKTLQYLSWNESGDPLWRSFDYADNQWDSASFYHEGTLIHGFTEVKTDKQFLIKGNYRFEAKCKKVLVNNNDDLEIDPAQSYVNLDLQVSASIGYSQYLSGGKTFADQKGRKANLTLVLIDSDLDGRFTENDSLKCSISNSFYLGGKIPFGTPLKLNSKSKTSYRINLVEKPDGTYSILIKPC